LTLTECQRSSLTNPQPPLTADLGELSPSYSFTTY